ncbi:MAG TPA: hypothetical protein VMV10_23550 [Pirellulales bacterium]|nr:hypothetical protein [Pirellulales bacterium]
MTGEEKRGHSGYLTKKQNVPFFCPGSQVKVQNANWKTEKLQAAQGRMSEITKTRKHESTKRKPNHDGKEMFEDA